MTCFAQEFRKKENVTFALLMRLKFADVCAHVRCDWTMAIVRDTCAIHKRLKYAEAILQCHSTYFMSIIKQSFLSCLPNALAL
jgi:hypothetical protein